MQKMKVDDVSFPNTVADVCAILWYSHKPVALSKMWLSHKEGGEEKRGLGGVPVTIRMQNVNKP